MTQPTEADIRAACEEAGIEYVPEWRLWWTRTLRRAILALARRIAAERELCEALEGMIRRWTASHQNWVQAVVDLQNEGRHEEARSIRNTALQALNGFPVADARAALAKAKDHTNG